MVGGNTIQRARVAYDHPHSKWFYHWAIYAPAAFLRTKSDLSLYGAPSMGSETTLPYA